MATLVSLNKIFMRKIINMYLASNNLSQPEKIAFILIFLLLKLYQNHVNYHGEMQFQDSKYLVS